MSRIISSNDDLWRARADDSLRYAANAGGNSRSHSCRRPVESVITTASPSPLPAAGDGKWKVARHVLGELRLQLVSDRRADRVVPEKVP